MNVRPITEQDRAQISAEIRAAESRTAGEIYVVIDREAHAYWAVPMLWASLIALLMPWPLHLLTYWATTTILVTQVLTFVAVSLLASHPALHFRLVPRFLAADRARRMAQAQFMAHGVHLTENRTGVLIYVAIVDRRVEIVADAGINSKVAQSEWDELADQVANSARVNRLLDGLLLGVRRAGILLAEHFPRSIDDRNELPDSVVEI